MDRLWISAVLISVILNHAAAEYQMKICTKITENHGMVPPPLPTNFEMRSERVDHFNEYAQYEESSFDYTNSRAKFKVLIDGIEHHFILDFETQQVVEYERLHPGSHFKQDPLSLSCTATNMEDSEIMDLFGSKDLMKPRMYTSNQALRFGGQYLYAFNNSESMSDRGIAVNNFIGCVYDISKDVTMKGTYSFTAFKVAPSGGTLESVVTGMENSSFLSVPVKMRMQGVEGSDEGTNVTNYFPFDDTVSVSWFQGEPEFQQGTFQIPPWVYCENYRGRKDKPKFPEAFSTRLQITKFKVDSLGQMTVKETTSFEQIYYYKEKRLARRDYTPVEQIDSEIFSKFQSYAPVKTIYDFNEGLLYVTHKPTGKCYIRPIVPGEYFDVSKGLLFLKMGSPEEIFHMETNKTEYKGTAFARDIDCDVWTGKYFDKEYNKTLIKETYISTNGWHEEADETVKYGVPVQHALIDASLDSDLAEGVSMYNFLKFKAKPPLLYNFDVSNCIETQDHQYLAIDLSLSSATRELLFKYKYSFLETAQYYLTGISQVVTPLRVQRLQLRKLSAADQRVFLVFVLVGKAKLKTNAIVTQTGANLQDAISYLRSSIDRGGFAIQFIHPSADNSKVTEMTLVTAQPSSLYNLTSTGSLQGLAKESQGDESRTKPTKNVHFLSEPILLFDESDESDESDDSGDNVITVKGMSPGALALLSFAMLFIGVGIGIAVMYLYIRKFSSNSLDDRIAMSNRPNSERSGNAP